jgi:protoporphyrinogen oxidase
MFGKFHEWPLRPSILASMPPTLMVRGAKDLLLREKLPGESFEADVVNKYGRTLYNIFFKPYTEKFLFHSPAELHRDWGRAGVNRAVIDKRAAADNLWTLLRNTLMPKPVETTFLYPPTGVGRFSEKLTEGIERRGGRVILGRAVDVVEAMDRRIQAVSVAGERIPCENLVWTAPITDLNRLVGIEAVSLRFLSTIFYNLILDEPLRLDYQWTYFGGEEVFSRISAPVAFAKTMAPEGQSSACVELTCRQGDERWQHPDRWTDQIVRDLSASGAIGGADRVREAHIERVPNTYPIYTLDYNAELTRNLRALGRYTNLLMAGRCGRFWYNNMDHSIGQGLTMAEKILRGDRLSEIDSGDREFWAEGAGS